MAVNDAMERRVAIKVLHPESAKDRETASRFFDEARAVHRIEHPSLVQISDYGQTETGTAYLVMEFLRGESLAQRIDRAHAAARRLDGSEVARIAWQTADALRAAHEKHIVFGSLGPGSQLHEQTRLPSEADDRKQRQSVGLTPRPINRRYGPR